MRCGHTAQTVEQNWEGQGEGEGEGMGKTMISLILDSAAIQTACFLKLFTSRIHVCSRSTLIFKIYFTKK